MSCKAALHAMRRCYFMLTKSCVKANTEPEDAPQQFPEGIKKWRYKTPPYSIDLKLEDIDRGYPIIRQVQVEVHQRQQDETINEDELSQGTTQHAEDKDLEGSSADLFPTCKTSCKK